MYWWWFWHTLFEDIRYFNIPLSCRECAFLWRCRKPWYKGHGCWNGCRKIRFAKKMKHLEDDADRLDSLVRYLDEQEQMQKKQREKRHGTD